MARVATRESLRDRGRRRGVELTRRVLAELRLARIARGISQSQLARAVGCSQTEISSLETNKVVHVSLRRITEVAAVLGLKPAINLYPEGEALHDSGHEALIGRLLALLSTAWRVFREAPFPNPGDPRFWDALLRLPAQRVGVEAETRVRDFQAIVRRVRERLATGGVDCMLLILSDSAANRRVVDELRAALGEEFATTPVALLRALREGRPLPGSGVVLL